MNLPSIIRTHSHQFSTGIYIYNCRSDIFTMGSMEEPPPNGYFYKTARTNSSYFTVESAKGIYLNLANGQKILDGTCGAAVASIGHGDDRVKKAMIAQMDKVSYCHPGFFKTDVAQELAQLLVDSTEGKMARAAITGSGMASNDRFYHFWRILGNEEKSRVHARY